MIEIRQGDLLRSDAEALVNTVNTAGVMGKGIALQFRRAWPAMFDDYVQACAQGGVKIGRMHLWETGQLSNPRLIINFPTKRHWRSRSQLPDIEAGLTDLVAVIRAREIRSIAIPPLGCGNGGLDWVTVRPIMEAALLPVAADVDITIFAPGAPPPPREMINRELRPELNGPRTAMIAVIHEYTQRACHSPSLVEVQKLAYFLQLAGEDLRLEFVQHHYGPYSDELRRALSAIEGHYLVGFGDGSATVHQSAPIEVMDSALDQVDQYLRDHPATSSRIAAALQDIGGFESQYGLELLATVQWVMAHNARAVEDPEVARADVHQWSPRKGATFTDEHIRVAWKAVVDRHLVSSATSVH